MLSILNKVQRSVVLLSLRYWFIYLLVILLLAFRSSCYESYRIPSHSMTPTLINGDYIIVDKKAYGFRVPFTELAHSIYPLGFTVPKRGDVIVFKFPKDRSVSYVKRVVGLPGDTIEILKKRVILNGVPLSQHSIASEGSYFKKLAEANGEKEYHIQHDQNNYYQVDYKKIEIPKGSVFVLGDNRDYSFDSRFWGMVPFNLIEGRAEVIWLSAVIPFANQSFVFRPERSFRAL